MNTKYDIIVVGGGHAGSEAAAAAAHMGCKTLLITMNLQNIAQMSCNPAMGGVAKGQIVREIDALGGYSGIITDLSMIQFKMLNLSKGPAMWSPRAQCDRMRFAENWRLALEKIPTLDFFQDMAVSLTTDGSKISGVTTAMGYTFEAQSVILTNGTFLNGLIHIGEKNYGGGRMGEKASTGITECLQSLGFESGRMKTGTPPRVDGRSLDYAKMEEQPGDENPGRFSFTNTPVLGKQKSCFITYTNPDVHEELQKGFDRSPMFNGTIESVGPRYCPSIEDKINRFAERNRHQIFVEPEGWETIEIYVNGFSTSLPAEVQEKAIRLIPGFENCKIFRPGYAIEYDYFPPTQLKKTLETKLVDALYFAGQINGTTGYEEAAAQGLIAGINAALQIQEKESFVLGRDEAYIGVLIDDLIHKGTEEPYRMFTSRAEHRLLLRQDNADIRLTEKGYRLGLAEESRLKRLENKTETIETIKQTFYDTSVIPEEINPILLAKDSNEISQKMKGSVVLSRPNMRIEDFYNLTDYKNLFDEITDEEAIQQAEIQIKYKGYIDKENEHAAKQSRLTYVKIPSSFNYNQLPSLSAEAKQKLSKVQPETIADAQKISGVSPSDISVLLVHLGR